MATVSASPSISCYTIIKPHKNPSISSANFSCSLPIRPQLTQSCISIPNSRPISLVSQKRLSKLNKIRVSETEGEEALIPEPQEETEATISVPVSVSDILTMFFQQVANLFFNMEADGTMSDAAIPSVTNALQETEGISDLNVQVLEGIASVELKKKTTVQATGVASNLVEIIQSSGFKLQALNLSFEDEVTVAT